MEGVISGVAGMVVSAVPVGVRVAMGDVSGTGGTSDGALVVQPHEKQSERMIRMIRTYFFIIS